MYELEGNSTSSSLLYLRKMKKPLFEFSESQKTTNPVACRYTTAASCLNQEIKNSYSGAYSILPEAMVAGSVSTFMHYNPQMYGTYPSVVNQDIECRYLESTLLLNNWNLWVEKENFSSMMPYDRPVDLTNEGLFTAMQDKADERKSSGGAADNVSEDVGQQASILIRILTMNRPEQLYNLLHSLETAKYENDTVDIEIHIDVPLNASQQSLDEHRDVLDVASRFEWIHGDKRIVDPGQHRGIFKMWVQPFIPRLSGQVLLVLEDDNQVSPDYYSWCKTLLEHIALYHDPKLYGFSLQRQHSVIGISPTQKYSWSFLDLRMDISKRLYRYQLLSSWGSIMFPTHWNNFVDWATEVKSNMPDFHPCIPYFINNGWYNQGPTHIWTIWFNYYIYMHGLYSLYFNYAPYDKDGRYFSLLKNHRSTGLHFNGSGGFIVARKVKKRAPDMQDKVELLLEPPPKMLLPPMSYNLYDFHFQFVPDPRVLDDRWRLMSGISDRCISNRPDKDCPSLTAGRKSNSTK